jgi:hypothetical protein
VHPHGRSCSRASWLFPFGRVLFLGLGLRRCGVCRGSTCGVCCLERERERGRRLLAAEVRPVAFTSSLSIIFGFFFFVVSSHRRRGCFCCGRNAPYGIGLHTSFHIQGDWGGGTRKGRTEYVSAAALSRAGNAGIPYCWDLERGSRSVSVGVGWRGDIAGFFLSFVLVITMCF